MPVFILLTATPVLGLLLVIIWWKSPNCFIVREMKEAKAWWKPGKLYMNTNTHKFHMHMCNIIHLCRKMTRDDWSASRSQPTSPTSPTSSAFAEVGRDKKAAKAASPTTSNAGMCDYQVGTVMFVMWVVCFSCIHKYVNNYMENHSISMGSLLMEKISQLSPKKKKKRKKIKSMSKTVT